MDNKFNNEHFDIVNRQLVIDQELCEKCSVANDNWGRRGVTPFAVACFVYKAVKILGKTPEEVYNALMTKWDRLTWRTHGNDIHISLWNKLFNGYDLSRSEWSKIVFPLDCIDTILTSVTSANVKRECYPRFFGRARQSNSRFMICTKESYEKAILKGTSVKVTDYFYGDATGFRGNLYERLRKETTKVIFPLGFGNSTIDA